MPRYISYCSTSLGYLPPAQKQRYPDDLAKVGCYTAWDTNICSKVVSKPGPIRYRSLLLLSLCLLNLCLTCADTLPDIISTLPGWLPNPVKILQSSILKGKTIEGRSPGLSEVLLAMNTMDAALQCFCTSSNLSYRANSSRNVGDLIEMKICYPTYPAVYCTVEP